MVNTGSNTNHICFGNSTLYKAFGKFFYKLRCSFSEPARSAVRATYIEFFFTSFIQCRLQNRFVYLFVRLTEYLLT